MSSAERWTLDHDVHVFAQTESRPGPLTGEGEQWMESRHTGKVMVLCRCGYFSGLIDRAEMERTVAEAEHGSTLGKAQVSEVSSADEPPVF